MAWKILVNLAWISGPIWLEIQDNLAWKPRHMWPRNQSQFDLNIWENMAWKVLANLAWNLGQ